MKTRAEFAIVLTALIWGSTFTVVKNALAEIPPLPFLAVRFALATLLLAAIFRRRLILRFPWQAALVPGGLLFAGFALQTHGLVYTSASKSAFLTALNIVLVPLLAPFVSQAGRSWRELGAAGLALAGTALMTTTPAGFQLGYGDLLTVGCAVAFAGHLLAVEYFSRRMNFHSLSVLQVAVVAAASGLAWGGSGPARITWSASVWLALLATAVLGTAFCFSLYTWAQQHTTASRAALLLSLEPVFAGTVAWAWAGEQWTARGLLGAAMILSGVLAVELKPARAGEHLPMWKQDLE